MMCSMWLFLGYEKPTVNGKSRGQRNMRFRSHYAPFWLLLEKGYNSILPNHNIVDANEYRFVSLVQSISLLSVLVHTTCSSPSKVSAQTLFRQPPWLA